MRESGPLSKNKRFGTKGGNGGALAAAPVAELLGALLRPLADRAERVAERARGPR